MAASDINNLDDIERLGQPTVERNTKLQKILPNSFSPSHDLHLFTKPACTYSWLFLPRKAQAYINSADGKIIADLHDAQIQDLHDQYEAEIEAEDGNETSESNIDDKKQTPVPSPSRSASKERGISQSSNVQPASQETAFTYMDLDSADGSTPFPAIFRH
ncbi:hypothetical protein LY76DRAFT_601716 [Colletotrichum caudatum]|nr:hypothetical protein LY76DRAFT_601716 [Colletotrichum caudatum]